MLVAHKYDSRVQAQLLCVGRVSRMWFVALAVAGGEEVGTDYGGGPWFGGRCLKKSRTAGVSLLM